MEQTTHKILIVEDSVTFGRLIKRKLDAEFEAEITWAKTYKEAMDALNMLGTSFSVALLDYNLPDAPDGEVVEPIVKSGIPSIVFTGNLTQKVRDKVWAQGVADYIIKEDPNSIEYLIATVKRLFENKNKKILIVDDSSFFRKSFSKLLKVHQFKVLTANDGKQALSILKKHPDIELMLVDYNMPGMDGYTLCQKAREKYKRQTLSIIGMSASKNTNMAAWFIKCGANDFIVKESFLVEEFYCRVNQSIDNISLFKAIREASIKDFLTGLYNRRHFFETGETVFSDSKRNNINLVCAMLDIDYFKKVNDTYGHNAGDLVLKTVSSLLQDSMPKESTIARMGGEEFCVIIPGITLDEANKLFSDFRILVEEARTPIDQNQNYIQVTVSTGVCTEPCESLHDIVNNSDKLLYMAKNQGRNRVICSP